jgi:hypothetical protein
MADRTIKVLEPAQTFALLTLDEAKVMLGIAATDTSSDPQLTQMIDWYSAYVSQVANRVFAKEKVRETWRDLQDRRMCRSSKPTSSVSRRRAAKCSIHQPTSLKRHPASCRSSPLAPSRSM